MLNAVSMMACVRDCASSLIELRACEGNSCYYVCVGVVGILGLLSAVWCAAPGCVRGVQTLRYGF